MIIFQIFCLVTFLIGSIHHCLTFVFEIFLLIFKIVKKFFKDLNKIKPVVKDKKEDIKERYAGTLEKERSEPG